MRAFYSRYCGWWNWHLSSRFRAASVGSLWVLLVASPLLGWLLFPLGAFRMIAGLGQLFLNHELGRVQPLERRDRIDWTLFGLTMLASCAVAQVTQMTGTQHAWMVLPVAVPFTAIQLRMCSRSERAHESALSRVPLRVDFGGQSRRAA